MSLQTPSKTWQIQELEDVRAVFEVIKETKFSSNLKRTKSLMRVAYKFAFDTGDISLIYDILEQAKKEGRLKKVLTSYCVTVEENGAIYHYTPFGFALKRAMEKGDTKLFEHTLEKAKHARMLNKAITSYCLTVEQNGETYHYTPLGFALKRAMENNNIDLVYYLLNKAEKKGRREKVFTSHCITFKKNGVTHNFTLLGAVFKYAMKHGNIDLVNYILEKAKDKGRLEEVLTTRTSLELQSGRIYKLKPLSIARLLTNKAFAKREGLDETKVEDFKEIERKIQEALPYWDRNSGKITSGLFVTGALSTAAIFCPFIPLALSCTLAAVCFLLTLERVVKMVCDAINERAAKGDTSKCKAFKSMLSGKLILECFKPPERGTA
ncbi:hypothetical protein [Wolbachia endosymbiont of Ctenocephalides felis wCfeT]|uniref:hypothetical protein n=1 Tax=Wolbachia endosymbiont of Ctenocephalides felis wCfeT TaxID=2732593 RepID=UPI0014459A98|nr:hypothetical protein [Wolbachia endosymbiont of Ctenocephalides felis wCfeT]